ncbi:MAG: CehA/McbA family metallohydrolase, partial [Acidobacteriota bacterium]
ADRQLLAVRVEGRGLRPGERLRFLFGAGTAAAAADRYAETAEHFFFAVDGDGDGVRKLIDAPPAVDLRAGEPAQLIALLPSTSRPGDVVRLHLSVLDRHGNAGVDFEGTLTLEVDAGPEATTVDDLGVRLRDVRFRAGDRGHRAVELRPGRTGVLRVRVRGPGQLGAVSNPLQVAERGRAVYWGDLQNHSNYSDGTALPEELYAYARDIAALDVASVTDHDHWGLRFLDRYPDLWRHIQEVTERFHEPGRFVTVRGFEWTHWVHGHRHVLVFDDAPLDILSSVDEATDHPDELWAALAGRRALTVAHHSAGGPISTDWSIAPPPGLEPVTEIVSVHGSSEAADSPKLIYRPVDGNFVRDAALGRGYRLGFIGSSDGHDGHPGLGHLASGTGGLAAILADELTRDGVYAALRARRTYATSGVRILLRAVYGGYQMGSEVPVRGGTSVRTDGVEVGALPPDQLFAQALAPGALDRIDVIRGADVVGSLDCRGRLECRAAVAVDDLGAGEFLYVRAVQRDGHFAVSSPFFFVEP